MGNHSGEWAFDDGQISDLGESRLANILKDDLWGSF